jgi:hypothetical protein
MRILPKRTLVSVATACLLLANTQVYAMNSSNYRINPDSINFGGGQSSGSSYNLEDTIGEVGSGTSSSTSYRTSAGYQEMLNSYLAVSAPADITMAPTINGLAGGIGNATASWAVTTDNAAGYQMHIQASTNPALSDGIGNGFPDYAPATAEPDYAWQVPSTSAAFGFTAEGESVAQRYLDDGSQCNPSGGLPINGIDTCWDGLSTTPKLFAHSVAPSHPNGAVTNVKFRAESGSQNIQADTLYIATITVTVLPL